MKGKGSRDLSRLSRRRGARYMEAATRAPADDRPPIMDTPIRELHPSPFQPAARPSPEAVAQVRAGMKEAGSLEALLDASGAQHLNRLSPEARELAALARDIQANGVDTPLEARRVGDRLELLSGHRRWTMTALAGLSVVPVADLGEIPDEEAASIVFRRNRLRADLTPWQEARALLHLREQQEARGNSTSVRALARMAGYSHGKAGGLLQIGDAFLPLLSQVGAGHPSQGEAMLAKVGYRVLQKLARLDPPVARVAEARRAAGVKEGAADETARSRGKQSSPARPPAARLVQSRKGGVRVEVARDPDQLEPWEAKEVLDLLAPLLKTLRTRARKQTD
ncbi:MAG: ParB N-terminal domain-containing protein [Gemmatimonadota bacterium]